MIATETCRLWDAWAGEWKTVTVDVTPEPRRRGAVRRTKIAGAPRDTAGLSAGSPLPAWWRDTAYADMGPLADMRTWVKPASMRTHRAATVMPADPGRVTETKATR
jgi:hypothetical protein